MKSDKPTIYFPAEWAPQSGVQLTWPHEKTDWHDILDEVTPCFTKIAKEISKREKLLIVCQNKNTVLSQLESNTNIKNILFEEIETNDTWARDHGGITVLINEQPVIYDFCFNGWGMKFAANLDNLITRKLFLTHRVFNKKVEYKNMRHFVLEGGSIESDGQGTLLTTAKCLLSDNRNEYLDKPEIEDSLKRFFGIHRILWLNHGYLAGDDTDSHIDTLARFCNENTIAYVQCTDKSDVHYKELKLMEEELQAFRTADGAPYCLVPLPMADLVTNNGKRLPATYANFLIINGAVLLPTYNSPKDKIAKAQLEKTFSAHEIIAINCLPLVKQYGSLHCLTMQYPEGILI